MKVGRHSGKIVECDTKIVGEKETRLCEVTFELEAGEKVKWTGWFSEKINARTNKTYTELVIDQLLILGFKSECLSELANPKIKIETIFDCKKTWSLDITRQTNKNGEVLDFFCVSRIFDNEEKSFENKNEETYKETKNAFAQTNIKAMLATAKRNRKKHEELPF